EQDLLAEQARQRERVAVHVGQLEGGSPGRGEGSSGDGRLRAQGPQTVRLVVHQRRAEPVAEDAGVDGPVRHRTGRERDTHLALAGAFRLDGPARAALELAQVGAGGGENHRGADPFRARPRTGRGASVRSSSTRLSTTSISVPPAATTSRWRR